MPALPWWFLAMFALGVNFAIWGTIGVIRLADSHKARMARRAVFALGVDVAIWGMTAAIRLAESRTARLARRCPCALARRGGRRPVRSRCAGAGLAAR